MGREERRLCYDVFPVDPYELLKQIDRIQNFAQKNQWPRRTQVFERVKRTRSGKQEYGHGEDDRHKAGKLMPGDSGSHKRSNKRNAGEYRQRPGIVARFTQ